MGNLFAQQDKPIYWKDLQPGDVQSLAGTIVTSYKDVLTGPKGDSLKFSELTPEQKKELTGPPGKDGAAGKDGALSCTNNQCVLQEGNLYVGDVKSGYKNRKLNVVGNNISVVNQPNNTTNDASAGIEFLVGTSNENTMAYYDFFVSQNKSMVLRSRTPGVNAKNVIVASQDSANKHTVSFPEGKISIGSFQIWEEGGRLYFGKDGGKSISIAGNNFNQGDVDRFHVYRDPTGGSNYFYINQELQFGRNNYKPQQW